jgi:hypothetical protein
MSPGATNPGASFSLHEHHSAPHLCGTTAHEDVDQAQESARFFAQDVLYFFQIKRWPILDGRRHLPHTFGVSGCDLKTASEVVVNDETMHTRNLRAIVHAKTQR